jgi:hypothetical protein
MAAPTSEGRLRYGILRWSHALVWMLLAMSCFLRPVRLLGGVGAANLVASLALVVYLIFMATLRVARPKIGPFTLAAAIGDKIADPVTMTAVQCVV